MDEIEAIKWISLIFDTTIHMNAARLACILLDSRFLIYDCQLVGVCRDFDVIARHDRNLRK